MSYASVHLDIPPSANRMWRHARGRNYPSPEYKAWKTAAGMSVMVQRKGTKFAAPVSVIIIAKRPHALRDLDNLIKPTLDAMQFGGLLEDDNLVHDVTARWAQRHDDETMNGEKMRIEVRSIT